MKKLVQLSVFLSALLLVSVSCQKKYDRVSEASEDHSHSRFNAYFSSSCYSNELSDVNSRFYNHSYILDGDHVDVAFLSGNDLNYMSEDQWTELREVLLKGGAVVFLSPTANNLQAFSEAAEDNWNVFGDGNFEYLELLKGLDYIGDIGESMTQNASGRYAAFAFCKRHVLIMPDDAAESVQFKSLCVNSETGESIDSTTSPMTQLPAEVSSKAYDIDAIVDWVNESVAEARNSQESNDLNIEKLKWTVTVEHNGCFGTATLKKWWVGLKEDFERPYKQRMVFFIWSVYNIDTKTDLYLIQRNIFFEGSKLYPIPVDQYQWLLDANGRKRYYGPFLEDINVNTQCSASNCEMLDIEPSNRMDVTRYSGGFSWNINAGLTISENPGFNIGGGLSLSTRITTDAPDLSLNVEFNQNKPYFRYYAYKRPEGHFIGQKHDIAAHNLQCDLKLEQKWIYSVAAPPNYAKYSIQNEYKWTIWMLYSTAGPFINFSYYRGVCTWAPSNIALPAPYRAKQEWRMYCEQSSDAELQAFLTQAYEKYFYNSPFKIAANADTDYKPINNFIKDFENHLNNDRDLWRSRGFYGTYTFVFKLTNTTNIYKRISFTVN